MKKKFIAFLAIFACAVFPVACGSVEDDTLTVWCAGMDLEMISRMADEFVEANIGVSGVNVEICEDDNAHETFDADPAAAADVICIPHDQLGAFAAEGGIIEITGSEYINSIRGNTAPSVKAGKIDGKQYGFPSSFETQMLFYDKSIVSDNAALTLEGILSSFAPDDGYRFAMDFGNAYFSADWFFTYGCRLFGDNGEDSDFCDFDNENGVAAMTYIIENRDKFGDVNDDEAVDLFREHKLGAYISGPWKASAVTEALKGNYGCAKLPSVGFKEMKSFAGYKLYCVNANTGDKKTALDLAEWLTNPANQKTRFHERNLIPVASSLSGDADVAVSATARAVMAQGPYAIAMPSIPEMRNFWEPTGALTKACYDGEISISELQERLSELAATIKGG